MSQVEYDAVSEEIAPYRIGKRTSSAALLAWFLHSVWRIEPEEIDDSICDGGGDKGIDALVVDDDLREITVLQSKHRESADAEQGDKDLKNLWGSSVYFDSPDAIDDLLASKPNEELRNLIVRLDIRTRVAEGAHVTRLVFVTNGVIDGSGRDYIKTVAGRSPDLEVWDCPRLAPVAERTKRPDLRPEHVELTTVSAPTTAELDAKTRMAVALVPASELVRLPGLDDLSIFDRNVRLSEGRTRINRELTETVRDKSEHPFFPAYHNGLTLLTNELTTTASLLKLEGVGVVNGCQSLLALRDNKGAISNELNLLVKVVQVEPHVALTDKITYRTNNQNPVDIRDQRSSDVIQRDLQAQVANLYGGVLAFNIREGEQFTAGLRVFSNQSAAQLIMAVYLGEPWNAVRKVRLFDDDYRRIFNKTIDAHKLHLLDRLAKVIDGQRPGLRPELEASFASVRLTIAYLVARVLRESELGNQLLHSPQRWLPDLDEEVFEAIGGLAKEVIESVNFHVANEEKERREKGEDFDPKVLFKSRSGVEAVANEVVRLARRLAQRDVTYFFGIDSVRK